MSRKEKLEKRTCDLINRGRSIVLKRADGTYLGQHTCIQAGPDSIHWTYWPGLAMDFFNLEWALQIAPLYGCKVYSRKIHDAHRRATQSTG